MKSLLLSLILLLASLSSASANGLNLSESEAKHIGQQIWQNEGAGRVDYLTVWNKGEEFPSFGIGHFIWYPEGVNPPFVESFPGLRNHLLQQSLSLPAWLILAEHSPWLSREQFYAEFDGPALTELRQLMLQSIPQQVGFIIQRMERALPKILASLPEGVSREQVREQFYRVLNQPNGPYALIDYVNFKGEGVAESERYQGQGWGLLQVLQGISPQVDDVMGEFARSADVALTRRVANAPRDESRWLPGWRKRLQTYHD